MKLCMTWMVLAIGVIAAQAQVSDQIRSATISGPRGTSGKCTLEVRVDMSAEVDIYGTSGRLRTIAGQPASWTRMECTDPLPYLRVPSSSPSGSLRFRDLHGQP